MHTRGINPRGGQKVWVWILLAPTMVGLVVGAVGSIAATFGISFFSWDLLTPPEWVGVENYTDLPGNRKFRKALFNTTMFSIMYVPTTSPTMVGAKRIQTQTF